MGWKCKLLIFIVISIVLFLYFLPSIYYHIYPIPKPLDTLKRVIKFYERLDILDDEIPMLEKEFHPIGGYYESQIQPKYNKQLRISLKIQEHISLIENGGKADPNVIHELNEALGPYTGDPTQNFLEMINAFKDKCTLTVDTLDLLQSSTRIILDGLEALDALYGIDLAYEHEIEKIPPTLKEMEKMRGLLDQLLKDHIELASHQAKIQELIGTNFSLEDFGNLTFEEQLATKPELTMVATQAVFTGERIEETINSNKKFLQNAVPFMLVEINAKLDRFTDLTMKLQSVEIQWEQKYNELDASNDDIEKKMKILSAMVKKIKNKNKEKKTEF